MISKKITITSASFKLFKGFKDSQIDFSPGLNLLVGSNNSGKSSVLHAIYLAFYFLKLTGGISNQDKKRAKSKAHLQGTTVRSIPLPFHDEYYISEGLKKRSVRENSTKLILSTSSEISFMETMTFPGGNLLVVSSNLKGESGNETFQKNIRKFIFEDNNFPLFIPTFSGVASKEEQKTLEVVKFHIASGKSSEVLRNQLKVMKRGELTEINSYLKKAFGYEIITNSGKDIYLSSFYKEGEYNNLDISSAGSGFQQILQILVYIVTSKSNIILIDEPDAHLHYKLQTALYSILSDLAKKGKQIIIATHSQVFIQKAIQNIDKLILVDKSLREQKSIEKYEEGLKILYENGIVDEKQITQGSSLKLIGLEDKVGGNGFKVLQAFLNKLNITEPSYKFISNNGNGNSILPFVFGKEKIENISLKAIEFRDSDSISNIYLDKLKNKLSTKAASLIFLDVHEIENYLLDSKVIARVLRSKNIKVTPKQIERIIIVELNKQSVRDRLFDSLRKVMKNQMTQIYRQVGLEYPEIFDVVEARIKEIRENNYVYPFNLLPGKEIIKILIQLVHSRYKVRISEVEIAQAFEENEIPSQIKNSIKFIE